MIDKYLKKRFLQEWIDAVNQHGGFGKWAMLKSKTSSYAK